MRTLWTLFKVIIGLAIAIPLGIVALVLTLGIFGIVLGFALLAIKLALVAFVGYGLFRVARYFFAPAPTPGAEPVRELPMTDPYFVAAMRELETEMKRTSGR